MRAHLRLILIAVVTASVTSPGFAVAQQPGADDIQLLKQEIRRLQGRLERLERGQPTAPIPSTTTTAARASAGGSA